MHRSSIPLFAALLAVSAPAQQAPFSAPERPARVLPYPIELPPGFLAAIANGTRTHDGHPGAKHWTNYARYEIAVEVDPAESRVHGTAKMTYVNRSPDDLDRLVIHLYQDMMRPGRQRTRTIVPTGGLELGEVRIDGDRVQAQAQHDTLLTLYLRDEIASGEQRTVAIDYAFDIPKAGTAPRMGHEGDRVIYLGYWYPQFAVYDDVEGWVADPYRGNGEFYMDYADYDLSITAPAGYIVRATGVLQNPKDVLTDRALERLDQARQQREVVHVVDEDDLDAGEATRSSDSGKLTWKFHAENVRDAAVSLGRTYLWDATHAVVADKHGPGQDGTCMIHAVFEANAGDWRRGAEYARHAIEYMSKMVHPYPWPHMTACEGIIGGGMEYPMMTIIGGRRPAGTIFHELIHMWFPMLLGSDEKRYAWQDEGFTSFWTTLCNDAFRERSNGGKRAVLGAAHTIGHGYDVVCMRHADTYGRDGFGFASYSKPAAILHQLRGMLGDDVFFTAFREYAHDWAFKHPYPYDFFHTFSRVAQRDLDAYFRMWFFERWQLDHAIDKVETRDGNTVVHVVDNGKAVHPCVVEARYEDDRTERRTIDTATWWRQRTATVTFPGEPVEVVLDPDTVTIDVDRGNNRWRRRDTGGE
ncbi:MAG TPA: M1 family peptidase [bacterium]|nr:M1 family peptidase [bacterium]